MRRYCMYLSVPEVGSYVIGTVAELNREYLMHFSVWATSGYAVIQMQVGAWTPAVQVMYVILSR